MVGGVARRRVCEFYKVRLCGASEDQIYAHVRIKVQELAAGAVAWCASQGGSVNKRDLVGKLSKMAARGKHKQNAERDLQRTIDKFGFSLGARISTARIHMWDPSSSTVYETDLPAPRIACICFPLSN